AAAREHQTRTPADQPPNGSPARPRTNRKVHPPPQRANNQATWSPGRGFLNRSFFWHADASDSKWWRRATKARCAADTTIRSPVAAAGEALNLENFSAAAVNILSIAPTLRRRIRRFCPRPRCAVLTAERPYLGSAGLGSASHRWRPCSTGVALRVSRQPPGRRALPLRFQHLAPDIDSDCWERFLKFG